jgi:hypothetical protein
MRTHEPLSDPETMRCVSSRSCAVPHLSHLADLVGQGIVHIFVPYETFLFLYGSNKNNSPAGMRVA